MTGIVFGKLPAHGDFVARGLGTERRDALDRWLSASLAAAREEYGSTFEDRYDRALPCRCEGAAMSGALAASQDAAGRRFPVLVMTAAQGMTGQVLETALYDAIGSGWTADRLAEAVGDAPDNVPGDAPTRWRLSDGTTIDGAMPPDLLMEMLR